ncbi:MAG: hypothetical protein JWN04_4153, partial [Myxococcaceae bacterium]|nr:hypothetical protein [Myxococcaceae bacterium]
MRLCRARRLATFGLVSSLIGCSAVSDFDYSFHPSEGKDAGGADASQPDLDAQVMLDSGALPDASRADATTGEDGSVCSGTTCCQITEINEVSCGDKLDNDCDGKGDCADDDCRLSAVCCPNPTLESGDTACADKKDNDCDGLTDCEEMGCKG